MPSFPGVVAASTLVPAAATSLASDATVLRLRCVRVDSRNERRVEVKGTGLGESDMGNRQTEVEWDGTHVLNERYMPIIEWR
jgi:hypothetical protein